MAGMPKRAAIDKAQFEHRLVDRVSWNRIQLEVELINLDSTMLIWGLTMLIWGLRVGADRLQFETLAEYSLMTVDARSKFSKFCGATLSAATRF